PEFPGREPGDGVEGRRGRLRRAEAAEDRDPHAVGVETEGVGAQDRLRHSPGTALVDVSALVDEEVVADVATAHALYVVAVDTADGGGRLRTAIPVPRGRVGRKGRP